MATLDEQLSKILCDFELEFNDLTAMLLSDQGLLVSYCEKNHKAEDLDPAIFSAMIGEHYSKTCFLVDRYLNEKVKSNIIIGNKGDNADSYIVKPVTGQIYLAVRFGPDEELGLVLNILDSALGKLKEFYK